MQYSKPMIDLVMHIRKLMPSDIKPDVKLANPELISLLIEHYHKDATAVIKALVKELCSLAGENWSEKLEQKGGVNAKTIKVYRGQYILDDKTDSEKPKEKVATGKIYRGQVVYE